MISVLLHPHVDRQRWTLGLWLWLCVPFLPRVPFPGPLRHYQSCHNRDHYSDSDDEHGGCFCDAELAIDPRQQRPGQLGRVMARHVAVVVNVEVANVQDLAEDAMQITVAAPRVPWRGAMKKRQDMDVDKKKMLKVKSDF